MPKMVLFTRQAAKDLRGLTAKAQAQILGKLNAYAATGHGDVKALEGRPGLRLRSGSYRAIFVETADTVEVSQVGDRRDVYR